jgi:hypothetical protein
MTHTVYTTVEQPPASRAHTGAHEAPLFSAPPGASTHVPIRRVESEPSAILTMVPSRYEMVPLEQRNQQKSPGAFA